MLEIRRIIFFPVVDPYICVINQQKYVTTIQKSFRKSIQGNA